MLPQAIMPAADAYPIHKTNSLSPSAAMILFESSILVREAAGRIFCNIHRGFIYTDIPTLFLIFF